MTNPQSDRQDMHQAVIKFIEVDEPTISNTRQGLIDGKDLLKIVVRDINTAVGKQSTATGGAYDDKGEKKDKLVEQLYLVTSGTKGFAGTPAINDNTLQEQMNYSLSELGKIGDEQISPFTDNIVLLVTPHLGPALTGFGVDAAAMTELGLRQTAYDGDKSKGRSATIFVAGQTEALPPLFTKATKILREIMDPAAATLKSTQKTWFDSYTNARKIINTGSGTTALSGDVLDKDTNTGIYNVKVTASQIGFPDITVFTDANGHYKFVPIKRGTYTVTFTHTLYKDVVLGAFVITQGHTVIKNVVMEKK
ncbi:MAG: carboxypeptidase-like regulatory domain-containing protein [Bacteroidota bacterium]